MNDKQVLLCLAKIGWVLSDIHFIWWRFLCSNIN